MNAGSNTNVSAEEDKILTRPFPHNPCTHNRPLSLPNYPYSMNKMETVKGFVLLELTSADNMTTTALR